MEDNIYSDMDIEDKSKAIEPVNKAIIESSLDNSDPGDDTLRRFRYQTTYAAMLSVLMAETDNEIDEIFCEFHEDILVKFSDGSFTGVQIKTRDLNLLPFNLEDDAIENSFKKFVLLDKHFPELFKSFSIVSNAGFDKTKPAICINTLISKACNGDQLLTARSKTKLFIQKLSKQCDCTDENVIETIKKCRLKSFCALDDIHMKLINQLKSCTLLSGATESKLQTIADLLVAMHFKASSLHFHSSDLATKYVLGILDDEDEITQIISTKRISKKAIEAFIEAQKIEPVTLLLKDRHKINAESSGHRRLEVKMDAGLIDSDNIDLLRNFKFSFEQHIASWIYKNDGSAEDKYNQVIAITQNLCKEIYDEEGVAQKDGKGLEMLIKVRKKIQERKNLEPNLFFDCTYEHLLGSVGVLTESCKVWWSKKFDLE